ncbi:MAG: baseplate J/gp47 family protein [Pseudomonadota bacterium]
MSYTPINLARLPAPDVIQQRSAEEILAEMKAMVLIEMPELASVLDLESEPVVKLMEVCAYREMITRAQANDQARACLLAFATGPDLDHLGALLGVERLVLDPGDGDARPPIAPTLERDDDYRARIQLAPEAFSVAGPEGAYVALALGADGGVKDVSVASPAPGEVVVTVLSREGDGTATPALLTAVEEVVTDPARRPLGDAVTVSGAQITPYTVQAELTLYPGPDDGIVLAAAQAALAAYVDARHRLDNDVTLSGLLAALHQEGVQNVVLTAPAADIVIAAGEAAYCTQTTITVGGRDV